VRRTAPELNNVIRGLVMELTRHHGMHRIVGFRNGYQGFIARYGHPVMDPHRIWCVT
jgi:6-phosphofructokinase 1